MTWPSWTKKRGREACFCSLACAKKFFKGKNHPNFKDGLSCRKLKNQWKRILAQPHIKKWNNYEVFEKDVLDSRPSLNNVSLFKIKSSKPFGPNNFCWNNPQAQKTLVTFGGKDIDRAELATLLGMSKTALRNRIKKWGIEKAISTPRQNYPQHQRRLKKV